MLIRMIDVRKNYGLKDVLNNITIAIPEKRKIGLIGANGAGKTTLLRILLGMEEASGGSIVSKPGLKIGYVPQMFPDFAGTVGEYVLADATELAGRLAHLEERMGTESGAALEAVLEEYGRVRTEYDALGGEEARRKALSLLTVFDLESRIDEAVAPMSGGEKNILSLVRAVLARPELLVLDEPGNHLDAWGAARLEDYLSGYPGAVFVVTHNRYLLDKVAQEIHELDHATVTSFTGNYSEFRRRKLSASLAAGQDYEADRKKLQRLEALVHRFREIAKQTADPAWGKRLHARVTQLEKAKEEAREKPQVDNRLIQLRFEAVDSKANIALRVRDYSKAFDDRVLYDRAGFSIACGEKVALVGPNGCGKTTLLRDIVENGSWENMVLRVGAGRKIAYCAQNLDVFDSQKTVLEEFERLMESDRSAVHKLLSRFLFQWSDLEKRIASLSGGEKNRLQLARALHLKADFLILDEPTNHLDIPSREAVEDGLADFGGTLLVVSHDRYFLERVADRVFHVVDGGIVPFEGHFSEFWRSIESDGAMEPAAAEDAEKTGRREAAKGRMEAEAQEALRRGDYATGKKIVKRIEKDARIQKANGKDPSGKGRH